MSILTFYQKNTSFLFFSCSLKYRKYCTEWTALITLFLWVLNLTVSPILSWHLCLGILSLQQPVNKNSTLIFSNFPNAAHLNYTDMIGNIPIFILVVFFLFCCTNLVCTSDLLGLVSSQRFESTRNRTKLRWWS